MAPVSPVMSKPDYRSDMPAERICKPGPPLKATTGKTNYLVIGDSISIGYAPWVARMLGDDYQVQHAPWDRTDGGAKDSNYGLQCLHLFLHTAMLEPTRYDVIIFNFGMHDIDYSGNHSEEYVTTAEYAKNLRAIKSILLSTGAKVGYVLTTPVPYNTSLNDRVIQYNNIARDVMEEYPTVATADLYTWVIEVCGVPPYFHCSIADKQPSPHYTHLGYEYLSERVKDLIIDLKRDESPHFWKRQELFWSMRENPVPCKNKSGAVVTVCPFNSTCYNERYSVTGQGCCLTPDAVPCGDGVHCCPAGYECDAACSRYECSCQKTR